MPGVGGAGLKLRVGGALQAPHRPALLRSPGRSTGRGGPSGPPRPPRVRALRAPQGGLRGGGTLAGPPPPVVATLASSLRTPSRGDPPRGALRAFWRVPSKPRCEIRPPTRLRRDKNT